MAIDKAFELLDTPVCAVGPYSSARQSLIQESSDGAQALNAWPRVDHRYPQMFHVLLGWEKRRFVHLRNQGGALGVSSSSGAALAPNDLEFG